MSGEQAEERTAREGRKELRAKELLLLDLELDGYTPANIVHRRAKLVLSECSRLASRVEELENLIAKQPGCSRCNDSASGSTSNRAAKEIR